MLFMATALGTFTAVRTFGVAVAVFSSCFPALTAGFYMLFVATALSAFTAVRTFGMAVAVFCSCFAALTTGFYMLFVATTSVFRVSAV